MKTSSTNLMSEQYFGAEKSTRIEQKLGERYSLNPKRTVQQHNMVVALQAYEKTLKKKCSSNYVGFHWKSKQATRLDFSFSFIFILGIMDVVMRQFLFLVFSLLFSQVSHVRVFLFFLFYQTRSKQYSTAEILVENVCLREGSSATAERGQF